MNTYYKSGSGVVICVCTYCHWQNICTLSYQAALGLYMRPARSPISPSIFPPPESESTQSVYRSLKISGIKLLWDIHVLPDNLLGNKHPTR